MAKTFNITADCKPRQHYMVDLGGRLEKIKYLVDKGEYFTVNRARQYGKTTALRALEQFLWGQYVVVSLDFQKIGNTKYRNENVFSIAFARLFLRKLRQNGYDTGRFRDAVKMLENAARENDGFELLELFDCLSGICKDSPKPVVLMVDEVDSAAGSQVFLDFLAQLRACYIDRDVTPAFWSVILASVYDVKNLTQKVHAGEGQVGNSPWNIAADFNIDMSFSPLDIEGMLGAYEQDYHTGMDKSRVAGLLYDYTAGYPFLVSRLCKIMDEQLAGRPDFPDKAAAWTKEGFQEAVKTILSEKNTLFESLINKLAEYPKLREMLYVVLFSGDRISFNQDNAMIGLASMLGFVKNEHGILVIANRIFETRLYNLFLSEEEMDSRIYAAATLDKNQFIQDGVLNMDLVLEKFMLCWGELYAHADGKFIEDNGRKFFLLYLKPIINGVGNYYIESRTRDNGRTDVIVDYRGRQYIIEIKIWRGDGYRKRGEKQLADYLDAYHAKKGYLLSFNFNKKRQAGMRKIWVGDKCILEAVV